MNTQLKERTNNFHQASLINGEWYAGSNGSFDVLSPETREVLHSVGRCSTEDVDKAVAGSYGMGPKSQQEDKCKN